jgi:archaeal flagellin FlaB
VITVQNKFRNDEKAFTGLEAAIVLIAFVVVAAVFSYVMLGAGFFTTQKSQEVVHTGVSQASSSVEVSGDVLAHGDASTHKITNVTLFLQQTAGGSAVDMNKTLITYTDPNHAPKDLKLSDAADPTDDPVSTASADNFGITAIYNDIGADTSTQNLLIEKGEKFEIIVSLSDISADIGPNQDFQLEIKPPQGATYTIHRKAPPSISDVMTLN